MNKQKDREEKLLAIWMANKALDNPNADPDSDICTISRQFLRLREQFASNIFLREEAQKELQELRILNNETYEDLLKEREIKQRLNDDLAKVLDVIGFQGNFLNELINTRLIRDSNPKIQNNINETTTDI